MLGYGGFRQIPHREADQVRTASANGCSGRSDGSSAVTGFFAFSLGVELVAIITEVAGRGEVDGPFREVVLAGAVHVAVWLWG